MFTKKHYKAIAGMFKNHRKRITYNPIEETIVRSIIYTFESYFEGDNKDFDKDKFIQVIYN